MSSTASAARVRPHTVPNDLEPFWMPFTPNRQFKSDPRMLVGPMGAVFVRGSIYDAFMRGPGDRIELFHGYTYSGCLCRRAGDAGYLSGRGAVFPQRRARAVLGGRVARRVKRLPACHRQPQSRSDGGDRT